MNFNKILDFKILIPLITLTLILIALVSVSSEWDTGYSLKLICPDKIPSGENLNISLISISSETKHYKKPIEVKIISQLDNKEINKIRSFMEIPGTVSMEIPTSELSPGIYRISVDLKGIDIITHVLYINETDYDAEVYDLKLQTDRPKYQPGQTIKTRAVLLRNGKPIGIERVVEFKITDKSKKNLFKNTIIASKYGVASTEFVLPENISPGNYYINASFGNYANTTQRILVDRYVLPPFIVEMNIDNNIAVHGVPIKGRIKVTQSTGQSITDCNVKVSALIPDDTCFPVKTIIADNNSDGTYDFKFSKEMVPPEYMKSSLFHITANVEDSSGHWEEISQDLPINKLSIPFNVFIIPEQGVLKQGIENRVFLVCAYGDGTPVSEATIKAEAGKESVEGITSKYGVYIWNVKPENDYWSPCIEVESTVGEKVDITKRIKTSNKNDILTLSFSELEIFPGKNILLHVDGLIADKNAVIDIRSLLTLEQLWSKSFIPNNKSLELSIDTKNWPKGIIVAGAWQVTGSGDLSLGEAAAFAKKESSDVKTYLTIAKHAVAPGQPNYLKIEATSSDGIPIKGVAGINITDKRNSEKYQIESFSWNESFESVTQETQFFKPNPDLPEYIVVSLFRPKTINPVLPTEDKRTDAVLLAYAASESVPKWIVEEYNSLNDGLKDEQILWSNLAGNLFFVLFVLFIVLMLRMLCFLEKYIMIRTLIYLALIILLFIMAIPNFLCFQVRGGGGAHYSSRKISSEEGAYRFSSVCISNRTSHIRQDFPETLLWIPEIELNEEGTAEIEIPSSDSLTQWVVDTRIHDLDGRFGRERLTFSSYKNLEIEPDIPLFLVVGDTIQLPLRITNHSTTDQEVFLNAEIEGGLKLTDENWEKEIVVPANSIKNVTLSLESIFAPSGKITLFAYSKEFSDAVEHSIRIISNLEKKHSVFAERSSGEWMGTIEYPQGAVEGTVESEVTVSINSTPFLYQSLPIWKKLLRKPYGCFEQTSSAAYPNTMVLKAADALDLEGTEIYEKALHLVKESYNRLKTFEVSGGGFSLYGKSPANLELSAYGLLIFSDMSEIIDVDPGIIERTSAYINRNLKSDTLSNNQLAYTAWALSQTGNKKYIPEWLDEKVRLQSEVENDPYRLALLCCTLDTLDPDSEHTINARKRLASMVKKDGTRCWWSSSGCTMMYSYGSYSNIQATALAVQVFAKNGPGTELVDGAEEWLCSKMNGSGSWGTTQTTVQVLKALITRAKLLKESLPCQINIDCDEKNICAELNSDNPEISFSLRLDSNNTKTINISTEPKISFLVKINTSYETPWNISDNSTGFIKLSADDPEYISESGSYKTNLNISWNNNGIGRFPLLSIPVPGGYSCTDLSKSAIANIDGVEKVEITGELMFVYLDNIKSGSDIVIPIELTNKYKGTFHTPPVEAYLYYQPNLKSQLAWGPWTSY